MSGESRKHREAHFHDRVFSEQTRSRLWSTWYRVARAPYRFFNAAVERRCPDSTVLEVGCGTGRRTLELLEAGANRVYGIDISPVAVSEAKTRLAAAGRSDRADLRVMDAETLEFPDDRFDLVCGSSILHHLDLDRAYPELARVARSSGSCLFLEPLGHNPAINLYRRLTPRLRSPDEHPLRFEDISASQRCFALLGTRFFTLTTLSAVPLRDTPAFEPVLEALEDLDTALLRGIPALRRLAWQVVVELSHPHSPRTPTARTSTEHPPGGGQPIAGSW